MLAGGGNVFVDVLRRDLGGKLPEDLTEEEADSWTLLEHRRGQLDTASTSARDSSDGTYRSVVTTTLMLELGSSIRPGDRVRSASSGYVYEVTGVEPQEGILGYLDVALQRTDWEG